MKTKVFISHSSKDREVAAEICQFLEARGVSCWIAPRNVTPGKNYGAAIVDAIDECGVFVLILSGESNQSGQVVREVERAAAANAVLIPFRIENIQPSRDLEFYVSSSHWLDAVGPSREKHLNDLLSAITSWHGREKDSSAITSPPLPTPSPVARHVSRKMPLIPLLIAGAVLIFLAVIYFVVGRKPAVTVSPPLAVASPMATPSIPPRPTAAATASVAPAISDTTPPAAPILPPVVQRVMASSELAPQMFQGQWRHYGPRLAFDNDITTAWIANKSGPGEWIEVRFPHATMLTNVSVYGGYGVDMERFNTNNRVHQLRLTFSNGFNRILRLQNEPRFQKFDLPAHPTVEWVRFEIASVYPGSKYDSTPISEIKFNEPE
jgi:hypothetical protein